MAESLTEIRDQREKDGSGGGDEGEAWQGQQVASVWLYWVQVLAVLGEGNSWWSDRDMGLESEIAADREMALEGVLPQGSGVGKAAWNHDERGGVMD